MRLIADANIWYDIANSRVAPEQFRTYKDGLFATPTSLLEIASGISDKTFRERKGAAASVVQHATGVVEDTETHLARLWKVEAELEQISWMNGFQAIAAAESPSELESGIADFA